MTLTAKPGWKISLGVPACIFLVCFIITLLPTFALHRQLLTNAILFDLLITAPLACLFIIKRSTVSKLTAARVFTAGLLVAGWILKDHSNTLLLNIKTWVLPLAEVMIIFTVGRKFYVANKVSVQSGKRNIDFLNYCRKIMFLVTGNKKAGNIIAAEISVFYYASAVSRKSGADYIRKFTNYKENGILLILGTILFIFLIETTAVHLLLRLWNRDLAWVLTSLSFYTCLQLFAHMRAIKARPVVLNVDSLEVRNGLAGEAVIEYSNIEKIELSNKIPAGIKGMKIALIKGLENHNCIIYLKQPIDVIKIFGIKKKTNAILFFVDRSVDFVSALNLKRANSVSCRS